MTMLEKMVALRTEYHLDQTFSGMEEVAAVAASREARPLTAEEQDDFKYAIPGMERELGRPLTALEKTQLATYCGDKRYFGAWMQLQDKWLRRMSGCYEEYDSHVVVHWHNGFDNLMDEMAAEAAEMFRDRWGIELSNREEDSIKEALWDVLINIRDGHREEDDDA